MKIVFEASEFQDEEEDDARIEELGYDFLLLIESMTYQRYNIYQ